MSAPRPIKILVVEDDDMVGALIRGQFRTLIEHFPNSVVISVGTMQRAWEIIREVPPPDVAVLDLSLPDSMFEASIAEVEKIEQHCPVIIVTGHAVEKVREFLHLPQVDVIHKEPSIWKGDALLRAVCRAIARKCHGGMIHSEECVRNLGKLLRPNDTQ